MPESRALALLRRSAGVVTVTALLGAALAIGTGLVSPGSVGSAPTPVNAVPSAAASRPTAAGSSTPPVHTVSPAPPTSPAQAAGITVTAQPAADGSFSVTEVITLPAPATEITLRSSPVNDAGRGFEALLPTATEVEVTAGGNTRPLPDGPVRGVVRFQWDVPTSELQLHYRLSQVSIISPHSRPGRTLAAVSSLVGQLPADTPVTVVVTGSQVLSISCPQLPLAQMACSAGAAPRFRTLHPIPYAQSRVLVQYNRPARP